MLKDTGLYINLSESIDFVSTQNKNSLNFPTGRFFYDPWIILDEYKGTIIEEILSYFPNDIGEARIIILKPGTNYYSHADIDDRYHLNLKGEQSFLIDLENQIMHPTISDSKIWEMDAGLVHTAANFGSQDRLQLVVRKLLKENKFDNSLKIKICCKNPPYNYRYLYDMHISPYLNRAVKDSKLNNFSNNGYEINFDFHEKFLDELIKVIIKSTLPVKVNVNDQRIIPR